MFTKIKCFNMTVPISIRLINLSTGEILFTKVFDNFTTTQFEHKEKLYRMCDCMLRGIDKLDGDTVRLEIYSNKYPAQASLF